MEHRDAIRKRPGMYIGDTHDGSGLAQMVWELVANSLDEHLAGACSNISVELREDGAIVVEDDGRGIPVEMFHGVPFAEMALTSFHATPTLDGHAPHEHVGDRGVGLFPVCALSTWLELHVCRKGRRFSQRFARGVAVTGLRDEGSTDSRGTRITFLPDDRIFPNPHVESERVLTRLRELSYLLPNLTLRFRDRSECELHEPRGLLAYLDAKAPYSEPGQQSFIVNASASQIAVEVAARWGAATTSIESFANIQRTTDGGTHVRGLLLGLVSGLKLSAPRSCSARTSRQIERALSQGLTAIVCVRLNDPTFDQPTKSRLATKDVRNAVKTCVERAFFAFLQSATTVREDLVAALKTVG
jgi:DNA gyrase subunit B